MRAGRSRIVELGAGSRWWVLCRHELRRARRNIASRALYSVLPLGVMVFEMRAFEFGFFLNGRPEANGSEQAVPGQTVVFSFILLVFLGYSAYDEFMATTWSRLEAAGARPAEIVSAKLAVMWAHLLVHFVVLFGIGAIAFGMEIRGSVVALGVAIVVSVSMITAYGFCGFALARNEASFSVWCWIGGIVLTALGGGVTPIEFLPGWARGVAPLSPVYWVLKSTQSIILDGGDLSTEAWRFAVVGLFAVGFAVVGVVVFDPHDERRLASI